MQVLKTIAPLLAFITIGITGIFSQDFVQTNNTLFNWFVIPAFVLGIYYAFALTPSHPKAKGGGIAFGRIVITLFATALTFRAIHGYAILFNCYLGSQREVQIVGTVSYVYFPKPRQLFDKNSIIVVDDRSQTRIVLDVPNDNYHVGETFNKKMLRGSFGILYSPR